MDNTSDPNQAPESTKATEQPTASSSDLSSSPSKAANSMKRPMMLLVLVVLIFAVLLVWLAIAKHNKKTVTPAHSVSNSGTVQAAQVSITSAGFDPATLNVAVNTQVTWTNNDTAAHEVASDPYPKDDAITGFNNHTVLQKGETYSFMFTKAGTYTYHDELNPLKINGTIIVK